MTKTNCKLDSSLDEIPKSDPLRIKSFHSFLKLLKCFQTVQIMFGFLQKHHNSQLQNETSATAVSVILVECHEMPYEASIIYLLQMIFGPIKTTNYDLSIHNRSKLNRLVHRRYLVKSKQWNVTDLSAQYWEDHFLESKKPMCLRSRK